MYILAAEILLYHTIIFFETSFVCIKIEKKVKEKMIIT